MEKLYAIITGFLGTGVEFVEALTVVLAVGLIRGWKNALLGTVAAIAVLIVLIVAIGSPLIQVIQLVWVQIIIGLCSLLFGIRWLRKSIMRFAGLKALHNEEEAFEEELERQKKAGSVAGGFDKFAFMTTFSITLLEGLEAIFIVITFGLSLHAMKYTIIGAIIATLLVTIAGLIVRKPLSRIPENTMKYIVGIMLTSFGAFWFGEGIGVAWPEADLSILYISASLALLSYLIVKRVSRKLFRMNDPQQNAGNEASI